MRCHLLDAVFVVSFTPLPPYTNTAVVVLQAEPGLVGEDHSPLVTYPADVMPAPVSASPLVGKCQLGALGWATGMVLGSMQAVANSLAAHVDVGSSL